MNKKEYKAGDIINVGVELVVLDVLNRYSDGSRDLFVLTNTEIFKSAFSHHSNCYHASDLDNRVHDWLEMFFDETKIDRRLIKSRTFDLTTLAGESDLWKMDVLAAPLTFQESRKYHSVIPAYPNAYWLATAWMNNSPYILAIDSNSEIPLNNVERSSVLDARLAMIINSKAFEAPDLSHIPTYALVNELKKRTRGEK
jgi:hypothetical protein